MTLNCFILCSAVPPKLEAKAAGFAISFSDESADGWCRLKASGQTLQLCFASADTPLSICTSLMGVVRGSSLQQRETGTKEEKYQPSTLAFETRYTVKREEKRRRRENIEAINSCKHKLVWLGWKNKALKGKFRLH